MTLWEEEFEPANPELKKDVYERLIRARENGLKASDVKKASGGKIGVHTMYDMMEAKVVTKQAWETMDKALRKLGY